MHVLLTVATTLLPASSLEELLGFVNVLDHSGRPVFIFKDADEHTKWAATLQAWGFYVEEYDKKRKYHHTGKISRKRGALHLDVSHRL